MTFFILNNDEHILTVGDCNLKTFLYTTKQHILIFRIKKTQNKTKTRSELELVPRCEPRTD